MDRMHKERTAAITGQQSLLGKFVSWIIKRRRYLVAFAIGAALMPKAVAYAMSTRGYKAIGGEFLIIPLFLGGVYLADLIRQMFDMLDEQMNEEDDDGM